MISCVIIDGDPCSTELLKKNIQQTSFFHLRDIASNSFEAIEILQSQKIDLFFLDTRTPGLSGTDLLKIVRGRSKVILCTDCSSSVLEGFDHQVIDYLLKPISDEQFFQTALKVLDYYSSIKRKNKLPDKNEKDSNYIFVKTEGKGRYIKIFIKEICYIEGLGNYVSIYTRDGSKIITYCKLQTLQEVLQPNFFRVHKSYLVSMNVINAIEGNQILLSENKFVIPLGAKYRSLFFEEIQKRIVGGKI